MSAATVTAHQANGLPNSWVSFPWLPAAGPSQGCAASVQNLQEQQYKAGLHQKLQCVFASIAQHFYVANISVLQVWFNASSGGPDADALQMRLYADPNLVLMGDCEFATFRASSCQAFQHGRQGMPGRVWKTGCVQLVQNLRIIPACLHPRSKLSDAMVDRLAEAVYVPVYDTSRPYLGPVAVIEALLSCKSTDSMIVANFISFVGSMLTMLKLSLSNPVPTPVGRSNLAGRRVRPPLDEEDEALATATATTTTAATAAAAAHGVCGAAHRVVVNVPHPAAPALHCHSATAPTAAAVDARAMPPPPNRAPSATAATAAACNHGAHGCGSSAAPCCQPASPSAHEAGAAATSSAFTASGSTNSCGEDSHPAAAAAAATLAPAQPCGSSHSAADNCSGDMGRGLDPDADDEFDQPPRKMQRTLSRTISVPSLSMALLAAVPNRPAQSC